MALGPNEEKDGGIARDTQGRTIMVTRTRGATLASDDVVGGGIVRDADGREHVVLTDSGGNDINSVASNTPIPGNGSPEGVVTAPPGQPYMQRDGADGKTLWIKETGTGNTGWRLKRRLLPYDITLYGPECRAAAAMQADPTLTTYSFSGSALSSSISQLLSGLQAIVRGAFWSVVWTPGAVGCGIELVTADAGPTNIVQIAELTNKANATPLNDGAFVAASTIQALFDFTAQGAIAGANSKSIGYRVKGNGTVGPLIYVCRLQLMLEV